MSSIESFNRAQAQKEAYYRGNAFIRVAKRLLFIGLILCLPGITVIIGSLLLCLLACVRGDVSAFDAAMQDVSIEGFSRFYIELVNFVMQAIKKVA